MEEDSEVYIKTAPKLTISYYLNIVEYEDEIEGKDNFEPVLDSQDQSFISIIKAKAYDQVSTDINISNHRLVKI